MKANSLICLLLLLVSACTKHPDNCAEIQQIRITGAKPSYFVGDTLHLEVNSLATSALYQWTLNGNPNTISGNQRVYNGSVTKADEGWYYLTASHPDCAFIQDSVYIAVINRPEAPPCSPNLNTVSFSNMPSAQLLSVTFGRDDFYGRTTIAGFYATGYPDLRIHFNRFWDSIEPEDGAYIISPTSALTDYDPYAVHIVSKYGDISFAGNSGKVYVTHVNGKLQATFCNMNFNGSYSGTAFNTLATGNISAP